MRTLSACLLAIGATATPIAAQGPGVAAYLADAAAHADSPAVAGSAALPLAGLGWQPRLIAADSAQARYDAWGARRSPGLALGEVILVNTIVWAFNEYIRGANFTQISPETWVDNFEEGWTYDDNHFNTNFYAHPYHGNLYYNAARSNGLNYWESAPFAVLGSLLWECCGETHPMSINDWINTSLGGIALGELTYRASSAVLDNMATGGGRRWREIGAFLLNPLRGFNRFVTGQTSEVFPNPSDIYDWRTPYLSNTLLAGVRVIGEGESISENTNTHAFFEIDFYHGSIFDNERRGPFDVFDLGLQVNTADKHAIGRVQVRGNLYAKDLEKSEKTQHVLAIVQHFDYVNNEAYEFGGQSFGAALYSRFGISEKVAIRTQVDLMGTVMGGVNSEFAFAAEVPDQERLREYDFGPGAGAAIAASAMVSGRPLANLYYRVHWIYTTNGSTVNGSDAQHIVQMAGIRALLPVRGNFGLGLDAFVFLRNSYYTFEDFEDITQRNPQIRIYGAWNTAYRRG